MFNKVVSIEFGLLKTKICEVDFNKRAPHIYRCISFDTPEGSYDDGYLKNIDALAALLGIRLRRRISEARGWYFPSCHRR